jgi:dTDP-4-dehydrorhamnose reductase
VFTDRTELDLSDTTAITAFIKKASPDYVINAAAYTAVDKAETEKDPAYRINAEAVGELAKACKQSGAKLIHISTDYVFNGQGQYPYRPQDTTDPVNYYGYTKEVGEQLVRTNLPESVIIRTSWVYSTHGKNFVKTMLRLMQEKKELKVVSDQVGCPTYAADLAVAIMQVIQAMEAGNGHYGLYHYSNTGVTTWYEFARAIRDKAGLACSVIPITTSEYPTPAKRPAYSVMDTTALTSDYGIKMLPWEQSLERCLHSL